MHRRRLCAYRPDRSSIVIVKGGTETHSERGNRFALSWVRYVTDDGEVSDVFRQQRWDRDGRRYDGDLPIDYGTSPAVMFASYVELYRQIAEQADGVPAPGQLHLPGCSDGSSAGRAAVAARPGSGGASGRAAVRAGSL